MYAVLILCVLVIYVCLFLNKISQKLGVPVLLAFILFGMLFSLTGIAGISFDDFQLAESICSVALVFIMFYGGFGTNWREARPVAPQAILLSTLGVFLTAGFTGLFCYFVLRISWQESFLLGALLGSTDAASVFAILRSKRLNLRDHTASLLELESGSNDPMAYMLTVLAITFMTGSVSGGSVVYMVFSQIVYGVAIGAVLAVVAVWVLRHVPFITAGYDTIFVFATAVLAYALPAAIGGNGYLSTYIVGIVLGNSRIRNKKTLVPFFDGINGLMQVLIFFLLGFLSFPDKMPSVLLISLAIAVFLTVVARPLAVFAILAPFRSRLSQMLLVSWSGLRGASSIVFAVFATMSVHTENDAFHIVFGVVLFSILLQGTLLPPVAKVLKMTHGGTDVMKTFTDYSDEVPVQFIQFTISEQHPWSGKEIKEILLPPDTILVLLLRGRKQIVPVGKTVLMPKDKLILSAQSPEEIPGLCLTEKCVTKGDELVGKSLSELGGPSGTLVILMKRKGRVIIPRGSTKIKENDVLVFNRQEDTGKSVASK